MTTVLPATNFKNYAGQKFGALKAIRFVRMLNNTSLWLFRCDCGNEKQMRMKSVTSGGVKSCGCLAHASKRKDYTGQKFGLLTAIKYIGRSNKSSIWLVKCDCGITKNINIATLARGTTVSCGCLARRLSSGRRSIDIAGQRFGNLIAIARNEKRKNQWFWECLCDCGKTVFVRAGVLSQNRKKSCGCNINFSRENHYKWKGGRSINSSGYVLIYAPDHPNAKESYILEHRLLMEEKIGRYLLPNENIHHINGVRNDNRIENLELWVKSQPSGQRPQDLVAYALEILKTYAPEMLSTQGAL